jgi:hypothetical protein
VLRLIQFLIFGHIHKWKIISKVNLYNSASSSMPHGDRYVLQCEICGNLKQKDIA